ncbi:MAG: hypothetical protein CMF55_00240 [Legionellales bacterium]|nr:hypothetical protein [Legionellales bacterium]
MDERELGLLSQPKVNMKIEEQAGEAPRITSTFSNETPSPNPADFAFDPMEYWNNISSMVDAEFSTGMSYGSPEDYGVTQQVQDRSGVPSIPRDYNNIYGQSTDYGVSPTTQYHPPGAMQQLSHMPNQQGIDPTSLAMQNMPYDLTGAMPNAFEGEPPPPTAYGSPPLSGGLQEPLANYPPPGYPSNVPTPDGQTFTQLPNTVMPGFEPMLSAAEGGMDAKASQVEDDWNATMEQAVSAGVVDQDTLKKTSAATVSAVNTAPLSNNINGQDASQNPIMSGQIFDPRQRQAEYLKQMNTIMMGGLMLDLAAAALGVKSRSGSYMDGQLKILEQTMKFDDQARIYDATKAVYYPDGVYQNPGTQADVFDSLMGTGMVTPAEASAISGYHPEGSTGYDTYFKAKEDGSIETIYVPKGEAPPEGATPNAAVAKHQADLLNPTAGAEPTAMQIESEVNRLRTEAAFAEEKGDTARAAQLKQRADDLLKLGGGASTKDEFGYTAERATFKDIYGSMVNNAGEFMTPDNTFRDANGNFIPWSQFRELWRNSYTVDVMGRDGQMRQEPGWLSIKGDPTESVDQVTIPTITTTEAYNALPSGKQFYDSTGQLATKQ